MRTSTCVALLAAAICLWPFQASAVVVFNETFDGPGLPGTLTYSSSPAGLITWSIDGAGRLLADYVGEPPNAGGTAITKSGFIAPSGLSTIYSLDVGVPTGISVGAYNVGIKFGDYEIIFHPGYTAIPGAFRVSGGFDVPNQNMGFVPKLGVLHHIDVETIMVGTGLNVRMSVTGLGTDDLLHTFRYSFFDPTPNLGIGQFGGRRSGGGNAASDAFFDNFQVQYVPEPSSIALLSAGGLGALVFWRRKRRVRSPGEPQRRRGWRGQGQTHLSCVIRGPSP